MCSDEILIDLHNRAYVENNTQTRKYITRADNKGKLYKGK